MIGALINFVGRRTLWRITLKDREYLMKYYNERFQINKDEDYAKRMTEIERKKIINMREANFWGRLSNLFN